MSMYAQGDIVQGKYKVHKLLGEGGMNRVYLVNELKGKNKYALKVTKVPSEVDSSLQEIYNQFQREIAILTTHSHPTLPRVVDYFNDGGTYCVVEEYIRGVSLDKHVALRLPDQDQVIDWGIALCEALDYLHKDNIIFRDLKPANIILKKNGKVKLIDFDIARFYKKGRKDDTTSLGTPGYAAPETYGDSQSDARSDIYSLGATLHHVITGVCPEPVPFHFDPIGTVRPEVSPKLIWIIEKALSVNPRKRFNSAADMKNKLLEVKLKLSAPASGAAGRTGKAQRGASMPKSTLKTVPGSSFPTIVQFINLDAAGKIRWLLIIMLCITAWIGVLYIFSFLR
jgi:serine/threonine protein kinase